MAATRRRAQRQELGESSLATKLQPYSLAPMRGVDAARAGADVEHADFGSTAAADEVGEVVNVVAPAWHGGAEAAGWDVPRVDAVGVAQQGLIQRFDRVGIGEIHPIISMGVCFDMRC